jgi:hypothetical protein
MSLKKRIERLERELFPGRRSERRTLTLSEFEFLYEMWVRHCKNPESVPSCVRQELEEFERQYHAWQEKTKSMQQPNS